MRATVHMWVQSLNLGVTYTPRVPHDQKARAPNIIFSFLAHAPPLEQRKSILRLKKRPETATDVARGMQIKQNMYGWRKRT